MTAKPIDEARVLAALEALGWADDRASSVLKGALYETAEDAIRAADAASPCGHRAPTIAMLTRLASVPRVARRESRPADWQQKAVDAARDALTQAWGWSDDSVMPARIAEVAVSAIIDAGLAGAGGRCPTCGETYPRTMPAGEDQRCWTCSTEQAAGLPEYGGGEQSLTDRLAAALKRLMRINAGEGVPVATWDEWEHLLAQHAANATPPTELTVSSTIAVPSRFARAAGAALGQNDARDWVRLYTGSGRQYEGYRSQLCPGDGVAGHEHDVRCVDQAEG